MARRSRAVLSIGRATAALLLMAEVRRQFETNVFSLVRMTRLMVVVVEPGLIRTEFAETAGRSVQPEDGGPYGTFNAGVVQTTREVYARGPLARLGGEADDVAAAIERVILLLAGRRLLPDRAWDRMLSTTYRPPTAD